MTRAATFPIEPGWRVLLKDLGIRPDRVLRRAGLPEDLFSRPQSALTTPDYFRFWESLQTEAGDPLFPLRVVEAIQAESFVPPIFAALCSTNMLQAVQRLATYKKLIAPMRLVVTHGHRGELTISPQWLEAPDDVPLVVVASELAFLLRLVRLATREPVQALQVRLPQVPARADLAGYAAFFGVTPRRGEPASVTLSATDAQRPFLTANDAMWQMFEPDLRQRLRELDASATTAQRVRSALLELLPGGESDIAAVAARLSMSKRTLQRRLEDEGDTFRTVVNRTREDLAWHYLTQTALPVGEIGFLLGFDDPNSFVRAFQEWTGQTPREGRMARSSSFVA